MSRISPGVLSAPHPVLSPQEWRQLGRERRKLVPRSSHAEWQPPNRPDPVTILEEQAKTRVSDLVPIRHGRMAASAFAYYRGAAAPMAWDLAHLPTTDIRVQCCGDAHLVNFGMFAAPDRRLVFDINDFDETLPASFDWDVKRLAASVAVAARDNGFRDRDVRAAARRCARMYRTEMAVFAGMRFRDVWYSRIDIDEISRLFDAVQSRRAVRRRHRDIEQAVRRTSLRALGTLCHEVDGQYQIKPAPPVIVRFPVEHDPVMIEELRAAVASYLETLQVDRREMLRRYYVVDFARKVVGVGSVGTEAFILLLMGDRADEPLFLQIKEAQESVLAPFAGLSESRHEGERVVNGQRLMQAAGDVFLGWTSGIRADGVDSRDYYVRQLRDMKGAMNVPAMDPEQLTRYAGLCGWTLARGHARTGRASMIAGYLGTSDRFDQAIEEFSVGYAGQNAADHQRLLNAIDDGRVAAVEGI